FLNLPEPGGFDLAEENDVTKEGSEAAWIWPWPGALREVHSAQPHGDPELPSSYMPKHGGSEGRLCNRRPHGYPIPGQAGRRYSEFQSLVDEIENGPRRRPFALAQ